MEIFADLGLFELLALLALAGVLRDSGAKRRLRRGLRTARTKLGRCWRCMTVAGSGVVASWAAVLWIGPHAGRLLRPVLWSAGITFTALASLHALVALYRALDRLERRVSVLAGGCGCNDRELPEVTKISTGQ